MGDYDIPRLRQVVIDTTDARASAEFWRQLLGLVYRPGHEPLDDGGDDRAGQDWLNLRTPDGKPCLAFQQVDDLSRATWPDDDVPQQLHLDLTVRSVRELDSVQARVVSLGGELRLDRSADPDEPLRVYADPVVVARLEEGSGCLVEAGVLRGRHRPGKPAGPYAARLPSTNWFAPTQSLTRLSVAGHRSTQRLVTGNTSRPVAKVPSNAVTFDDVSALGAMEAIDGTAVGGGADEPSASVIRIIGHFQR